MGQGRAVIAARVAAAKPGIFLLVGAVLAVAAALWPDPAPPTSTQAVGLIADIRAAIVVLSETDDLAVANAAFAGAKPTVRRLGELTGPTPGLRDDALRDTDAVVGDLQRLVELGPRVRRMAAADEVIRNQLAEDMDGNPAADRATVRLIIATTSADPSALERNRQLFAVAMAPLFAMAGAPEVGDAGMRVQSLVKRAFGVDGIFPWRAREIADATLVRAVVVAADTDLDRLGKTVAGGVDRVVARGVGDRIRVLLYGLAILAGGAGMVLAIRRPDRRAVLDQVVSEREEPPLVAALARLKTVVPDWDGEPALIGDSPEVDLQTLVDSVVLDLSGHALREGITVIGEVGAGVPDRIIDNERRIAGQLRALAGDAIAQAALVPVILRIAAEDGGVGDGVRLRLEVEWTPHPPAPVSPPLAGEGGLVALAPGPTRSALGVARAGGRDRAWIAWTAMVGPRPPIAADLSSLTAVVVGEDPIERRAIVRTLERRIGRVVEAFDEAEARDLCEDEAADWVVFLRLPPPGAWTGPSSARRFVLVSTGVASAGSTDFCPIERPIRPGALWRALDGGQKAAALDMAVLEATLGPLDAEAAALLRAFLNDTVPVIARLAGGDAYPGDGKDAHRCAGAARTLGAVGLADALSALEIAVLATDDAGGIAARRRIEEALARVVAETTALADRLAPPCSAARDLV